MADKEPLKVDGKCLSELRVVDLKRELDKRRLSKSGSKKDLQDRLKTQLQLERLREEASESQGEDDVPVPVQDSDNAFIAKYMKQRQQLLKDAQDNKKQVQEARRRESESQTSASEAEDGRQSGSGVRSPSPSSQHKEKQRKEDTLSSPDQRRDTDKKDAEHAQKLEQEEKKELAEQGQGDTRKSEKSRVPEKAEDDEKTDFERGIGKSLVKKNPEIESERGEKSSGSDAEKRVTELERLKDHREKECSDITRTEYRRKKEILNTDGSSEETKTDRFKEEEKLPHFSDKIKEAEKREERLKEKERKEEGGKEKTRKENPKDEHKLKEKAGDCVEKTKKYGELADKHPEKPHEVVEEKGTTDSKEETRRKCSEAEESLENIEKETAQTKNRPVTKSSPEKSKEEIRHRTRISVQTAAGKGKGYVKNEKEKLPEKTKGGEKLQRTEAKKSETLMVGETKISDGKKSRREINEATAKVEKNKDEKEGSISMKDREATVSEVAGVVPDEKKEAGKEMGAQQIPQEKTSGVGERQQAAVGHSEKEHRKVEEQGLGDQSHPRSRRSRSRSKSSTDSSRSRSSSRTSSSSSRSGSQDESRRQARESRRKEATSSDSGSDSELQPTPKKLKKSGEEESFITAPEDVSMNETQEYEKAEAENEEISSKPKETNEKGNKIAQLPQRPPRKRKWGSTRNTRKTSINVSAQSLKGVVDVRVETLKTLEPMLELDTKEDSHVENEPDDGDKEKRQQRRTKQQVEEDKRQVIAESESDGEESAEERKRITIVNGRTDDRLQHTSDSELTDSEEDDEEKENKPSPEPKETKSITVRAVHKQASLPIDEPVPVRKTQSPPRRKESNVIHVLNLVRPFTLSQLKELLGKYGNFGDDGFWIDKIKSHCFVTYETEEEAKAAREALHGTKWPSSNPKILAVDFGTLEDVAWRRDKDKPPPKAADLTESGSPPHRKRPEPTERKSRSPRRDREREKEHRQPPIREWDRDKLRQSESPSPERKKQRSSVERRSRSRDRRDRRERSDDRARSRERRKKSRKAEKAEDEEPPAKLLDDLFRKTKTTPCIYWLPLTAEQKEQRKIEKAKQDEERRKRIAEREKKEEEEYKRRKQEREEREKQREKMREERRREREKERRRSRSGSQSRNRRR